MISALRKELLSLSKSRRYYCISTVLRKNTSEEKRIKIGSVSKTISVPSNPLLVPIHYLPENPTNNLVHHLQWIMKKDILGQDIFLIGLPGSLRGRVVLQYLEMIQKEVEYVVLTRDTTENDLKQRREIYEGSAHYVDQPAVRAAIEGRYLILDGIEKVERNVLPVLNNLLENREMQLEDGRFLVSPEKYDKLLLEHTREELEHWQLVRVSENFRVVALGLPVPHFKGNPLDPPFRSRFQARRVIPNFEEQIAEISGALRNVSKQELKNFLSCCYTFLTDESTNLGLPKFPVDNAKSAARIMDRFPSLPKDLVFQWMYPYSLLLQSENRNSVLKTLEQFSIRTSKSSPKKYRLKENVNTDEKHSHILEISMKRNKHTVDVLGHRHNETKADFVSNPYHDDILSNMLITHSSNDFCIVGNRGCGKATLVRRFASLLNYPVEMVMLYNDMTARDLLQQRITDERGNTLWRSSPLIHAAESGKLLVLDGLQRVHSSTFSVLQRLVHNREIQLFDGTRLLRHDRFDSLKQQLGLSDEEMKLKRIIRVHPAFRIVGLAEPPDLQSKKNNWMTPEILSMFLFHSLRPLSLEEEKLVILSKVKNANEKIDIILNFTHELRNSKDDTMKNVSASFSTRQLIRMAQRLSAFPDENVYSLITQSCLMQFLPPLTKQSVENLISSCNIKKSNDTVSEKQIHLSDGTLRIGNTISSVYNPQSDKVKVPDILFYNSQEHISVMEAMLQDFLLGEHLLLVGNQGVGKNKITDRFLQLLNRPREYVQLHRDTTVQSLTQQPTIVDGRIVYEDSPLLKAVRHGRVLVVDEADKAPTHVTSILKALVVSGEMYLSDGRRIVHHADKMLNDKSQVVMHPNFRMIVLANRPGFPFLGNDFFATLGDIFSCHAVDNPSLESEVDMLRKYGPNVPGDVLKKLAYFFGDLRTLADAGLISYPYSTREVVNIVKHLNTFPDEGIPFVLKNVFDFDSYSSELKETLNDVFKKHGIALENDPLFVKLANNYNLPEPVLKSTWKVDTISSTWSSKEQDLQLEFKNKFSLQEKPLPVIESRANSFTEQQNSYQLPLKHQDAPVDIAASGKSTDDTFYVATANPISLYTVNTDKMLFTNINLSGYFPTIRSGFKPAISLSALSHNNEESVFFYESTTNQALVVNPVDGIVNKLNITTFIQETVSKISQAVYTKQKNHNFGMCKNFPLSKQVFLYDTNNSKIIALDFNDSLIHHIETPSTISKMYALDNSNLLLVGENDTFIANVRNLKEWKVRNLLGDGTFINSSNGNIMTRNSKSIEPHFNIKYSALMSNPEDYVSLISGSLLEGNALQVTRHVREKALSEGHPSACILPSINQTVRLVLPEDLPEQVIADLNEVDNGYLEVVDVNDKTYSYVGIHLPINVSSFARWLSNSSNPSLLMCALQNEKLITVDTTGCIRKWEISKRSLESSFQTWKKLAGLENTRQLTIEHVNEKPLSAPKHGKIDSTGAPHVGGNTWAGGTGGRDTAGLGGRGGPYRLDAGHNVFQVSDQEKADVPPEVREAARLMAMKAYKERLKEIEMSEYDAELYNQFLSNVEKQVKTLRVILDGLQAKSKDRQWMKHQTSGELDDGKLIEGITGEKSIYKRRGEQDPELGSPQEKPKLLRLIVDVSGSMYRFNGHDSRLQRELESVVLVMEAFEGYQEKFKYEIIGHSGEDYCIEFSKFDKPPKNEKERLDLIRNMHAHSQFCMSGDNTLEATEHAIKTLSLEEADETFIIVLSDANFERYGISPKSFGNLLSSNSKVNAFAIFIGSLGEQATVLSKHLPAGRAFICFDSANLTHILQKIFTSALLRD